MSSRPDDRHTERWAELLKRPLLHALRWFQNDSPASQLWEGTPFLAILAFASEQSKGWDRRQFKAAADHAFDSLKRPIKIIVHALQSDTSLALSHTTCSQTTLRSAPAR
jgi:hypothetical protein